MKTVELLSQLRTLNVKLWAEGEKLRYSAPDGVFTPELRSRIVERREEILTLLREATRAVDQTQPALTPVARPEKLPLAFAQQRLWFLDQLIPGSTLYNLTSAVRLTGALDHSALERTFDEIVRRHEILRTIFPTVDGEHPIQVITAPQPFRLPVIDLGAMPTEARQTELRRRLTAEARHSFTLSKGPLLRVTLLRLAPAEHVVILTMHHMVSDGWSMGVLLHEVATLYAAFVQGRPSPLPPLPIQYADYALWQRRWLQDAILTAQLDYWKRQLAGAPAVLELPTDRSRPPVQSFRGAVQSFVLPAALSASLKTLSRQEDVTLFMLLLAAFNVLLHRYSGQEDILVGSPIAGRNRTEVEGLIGFFVNTLVLRTNLAGNPSFRTLLQQVRETALGAFAHQELPFEYLVDELQIERSLSHMPLFQVVFQLQAARPNDGIQLPHLTLTPLAIEGETAKFDLYLSMTDGPQGLAGSLEYSTDLFDHATITRLLGHFQTLLTSLVADPDQRLSDLTLLTAAERHQLLVTWNDTYSDYPRHQCIHELFEAQAAQTPDAVAVVFMNDKETERQEDKKTGRQEELPFFPSSCLPVFLTYRELNARANQLAHYLRTLGVGKPAGAETLVGICMERSLAMVVGVLAILKAGGAYLPLDPAYPPDRLAFMLADTQTPVLLTQSHLVERLPAHTATVICLDDAPVGDARQQIDAIAQQSKENPTSGATADHLAYVMYTSGSTGRPKGISIIHRSVVRLVKETNYAKLGADEVFLQFAPTSFDAATLELWGSLLNGGRLVVPSPQLLALAELGQLIRQQQVTTLWLTAGLFHLMVDQCLDDLRAVRQLLAGGDVLSPTHVKRVLATPNGCTLINGYGPTENTTFTCCYPMTAVEQVGASVPIGRPIANTQVYILDHHRQPVPVGAPGELYIGGDGLARDYLNRPDLTADRFVPHPFSQEPGARLYRTGDLVRYRPAPDGGPPNIEFLGRTDLQVKIRGFRIELGEIEAALSQHPAVRAVTVIAREDENPSGASTKRLVAYVVPNEADAAQAAQPPLPLQLRNYLQQTLPDYMIPAAFVLLAALPINPNGKVDRRALPAPEQTRPTPESTYTAPRTPQEETLARIWSQVLRVEQVGVHDNFFELGGDSIQSIQVIARANQAGLKLSPAQLFQYPTVEGLARVATTTSAPQAEQTLVTGPVPLTPIQHWFFAQAIPDRHHWNWAFLQEVYQKLDPMLLEQAIAHLLRRHDALRLHFQPVEGRWQQVNAGVDEATPFTVIDLSTQPPAEQRAAIEATAASLQTSLNLSEGPLLRIAYFDLGPEQNDRLLIILHHLVIDGLSRRILLEDLATLYQQLSRGEPIALPPKSTSFKQWAEKLTAYAQSAELKNELPYWLTSAMPGQQPKIQPLPIDAPAGQMQNTHASAQIVTVALTPGETQALLQEVPEVYHTQINDVLLTALVQSFAPWTGSRTLLVDLEGHGREDLFVDVDLSRTVGWFTSIYPVTLTLEGVTHPGEALKSIKEQVRAIPKRGIGYGLLRYLCADEAVVQQLQRLPQAPVSFNYLGQFDAGGNQADDKTSTGALPFAPAREAVGPLHNPDGERTHLIEVVGSIAGGVLRFTWIYSTALHQPATMERLAQGFIQALRDLIAHCQAPEAGGFTPSDFQLVKLDQQKLDKILGKVKVNTQRASTALPSRAANQK